MPAIATISPSMRQRYQQWMHAWETRLNQRDTNRVVRPFEWGIEWARRWPLVDGTPSADGCQAWLDELNRRIVARSDGFFAYQTPTDFLLEGNRLRFTSAVSTPYPENNIATARWFPVRGNRAVVVLPQWNSDAESHVRLCRIFQVLGIAALRLSLPYHDVRMPAELERADYAVSSNLCRTIDAGRLAVADARSCLDWLEDRGYSRLGIVGTSLGSCYAFITSAHDDRLKVNVFNHASTYFADVVWAGQSTRHVRLGVESNIDLEGLRRAWLAISPMAYVDKFAQKPKKSLVVYATYDLTFPPELSRELIGELKRRDVDHRVAVLPCGHYTSGETPFKFLDAWHMAKFLQSAF
ncbi:MAG TPA: abhydrolase domain-containing 18 [Terriglobales bacterium]|nr:abhydrolase domain-containing 18 [Terriglobales bacterium]